MSDVADLPKAPDNRAPKGSRGYRPAPSKQRILANAKTAAAGVRTGRPQTYSPELCQTVIRLGAKGYSKASIAYSLGISRDTLHAWARDFPAFSDALSRAHDAAYHRLEQHGVRNLKADRYQAQVWKARMASQFEEYRDNPSASVNLTLDLGGAIAEIEARRRPAGKVTDVESEPALPSPQAVDKQR